MNRTLTHFCLRCLAHPVSNVQMILLSLPLMMSWVPLNLQPLTSIRYPNKMLGFMLEVIFARHIAKHSCTECNSSLAWAELSDLSDSSTIRFLQQKSCNSVSSAESGLTIPSGAFVSFLKKDVFVSHFMGTMHMSKVCQRLVSIILAGADLTFLPAGECRDNFTVAVHFYVKMRVFYAV